MIGHLILIDDDNFCNRMNTFVIEQGNAAKSIRIFEVATKALFFLQELIKEENYEAFPDVILLDLNMTYMDGWGFLEEFSSYPARYKEKANIYILTSSIQPSDRQAAEQHPEVRGYIEKPFTTAELNYIIDNQTSPILLRQF
jgi:two-component system, chemotaxis family, chemotaxis protein CheY